MSSRRGFTLIELLVTAALFAMVAGGLYGTYVIALRTWTRTQATLTTLPDLTVGFEHLASQLRSGLVLAEAPWSDGDGRLAFVTAPHGWDPMQITYQRTPEGRLIEQAVSLADQAQPRRTRQWVDHVTAFTVTYGYVTEDGALAWEPSWPDVDHLPRLLRLTVTVGARSTPAKTFTKTVWIPTGVLGTYERGRPI